MAAKPKKAASKKAAATPGKAPASKPKSEEDTGAFMAALDHPLKADIETIRKLILAASPEIAEGVKWNSLSFRHTDWFATVNLRSTTTVQLVMHTGAKAKDNPDFTIPDENGLLVWLAKDRALATIGSGKTLKSNTKAFTVIVKAWINYV